MMTVTLRLFIISVLCAGCGNSRSITINSVEISDENELTQGKNGLRGMWINVEDGLKVIDKDTSNKYILHGIPSVWQIDGKEVWPSDMFLNSVSGILKENNVIVVKDWDGGAD